jgi:formylglycine-generating enzyme
MSKQLIVVQFLIVVLLISFPFAVYADKIDNVVEKAVELLKNRGLGKIERLELIIEVTNKDTQEYDQEARLIQSSLYSTLQIKFPQAKLMLKEEAIAGISGRAIKVKGIYQRKKGKVFLNLQAIRQMTGEMIAGADVEYASEEKSSKNLVVVMPLEAQSLERSAILAFSTIFRSALINTQQFNLVSSDAIDKADPEKIQATYKCSREECSAIVAQQLNASRVITAFYRKISPDLYFLSGSLKDISTGRTLSEKSIKHDGNLTTLETTLEKLACQLANTCVKLAQTVVASVHLKTAKSKAVLSPSSKDQVGVRRSGQFLIYNNQTVKDKKTGLIWDRRETEETDWQGAIEYCDNLFHAGKSDWRLPSKEELKTLIDKSYSPKINTDAFSIIKRSTYWSSTSKHAGSPTAWSVYFYAGYVSSNVAKINDCHVRCVRKDYPKLLIPRSVGGMVLIPAGEFEMGSNEGENYEKPVHTVYVDAYYIDKYEVTVDQYKLCVSSGRCEVANTNYWFEIDQSQYGVYCNYDKSDRGNHPINCIDWKNAQSYCEYAGKGLPTEAEWEKAATWKSGNKYKYPSGKNSISCSDAVMKENGFGCGKISTWSVGSKPQEMNGTHDMAGNVWEWVSDWYSSYSNGTQRNPTGPSSGSVRVSRGGGWGGVASSLRGANRISYDPSNRVNLLGFRCARSVK